MIRFKLWLTLLMAALFATVHCWRPDELARMLLNGYDNTVIPGSGKGKTTEVDVDIFISSFDSFTETSMDYAITIYLRQQWYDDRLAYRMLLNASQARIHKDLTVDYRMHDKFWVPDIYFPNEKKASTHDSTVPNKLMRIYPFGKILYSQRLSLVMSCVMRLHAFPLDTQRCLIQVESFGYASDKLRFKWANDDAVVVRNGVHPPQFDLVDVEYGNCTRSYSTGAFLLRSLGDGGTYGMFSCVYAMFILQRQFGFYLLQVYIPSVLVTSLSWVSFWISAEAVPARVSVGVITVLTITTQISGVRQSLPKVSYVKSLDVWMLTCLLFTFAALLEFSIVNALSRGLKRKRAKKKVAKQAVSESKAYPDVGLATFEEQKPILDLNQSTRSAKQLQPPSSSSAVSFLEPVFKWSRKLKGAHDEKAHWIDRLSRFAFPGVFLLFNILYWPISMNQPIPSVGSDENW